MKYEDWTGSFIFYSLLDQLTVWLINWQIDWLTDSLIDLIDLSNGLVWLIDRYVVWLNDRSVVWLIDRLLQDEAECTSGQGFWWTSLSSLLWTESCLCHCRRSAVTGGYQGHSFIHSFIHLFIFSFIHLFIYSLIHLLIYYLSIYSFIHKLIYWFIDLFIYSSTNFIICSS